MLISRPLRVLLVLCTSLLAPAWLLGYSSGALAQSQTMAPGEGAQSTGPVRLRQTAPKPNSGPRQRDDNGAPTSIVGDNKPPREPDEFERFVSGLAGFTPAGKPAQVRRFGGDFVQSALVLDGALDAEPSPLVPADYIIKPGDGMIVTLWGSVDGELDLTVDRSGRISLPRVGSLVVAGVRFSDITDLIRRRIAQNFKNFELSVSMGELRGVRVFVTGFVQRPGAYSVTSLSTVSQALLKAGGPSPAGSFRQISLRRQGQPPSAFDLYDLLVKGDRQGDRVLQPDDVIHVGPVGPQVALIGSVNAPSIFEIKPGELVRDVLQMAGGFSPVGDTKRLTLERLSEREQLKVVEWPLPDNETRALSQGDVLRAVSVVAAANSQLRQNKRVRVEGEVAKPGLYVISAGQTLADALRAAGGLTTAAYLFGTELERESVRVGQQENYDRALRDVETEFARATATQRTSNAEEAAAQGSRGTSTARLIERLRAVRPSGRVVLELAVDATELPPLLLEDGDRLYVPARPNTVGVFGSVFSVGSYLHTVQRSLGDYLQLAGGPTRGADRDSIFVIRANGTVISESQTSGWFSTGKLRGTAALPGDTLFVPEELNKTTFVQTVKDWTQILAQFGLGVAAFKTLGN
jgi:protein involved in polysaccharide export with SLBB domain